MGFEPNESDGMNNGRLKANKETNENAALRRRTNFEAILEGEEPLHS